MDKYTLKDLIVTFEGSSFAKAFGITEKRADEIADALEGVYKKLNNEGPTWSASKLFRGAAELNFAKGAKEVAFVAYLIGCRIGEDSVYQEVAETAREVMSGNIKDQKELSINGFPRIKKGGYVN